MVLIRSAVLMIAIGCLGFSGTAKAETPLGAVLVVKSVVQQAPTKRVERKRATSRRQLLRQISSRIDQGWALASSELKADQIRPRLWIKPAGAGIQLRLGCRY